MDKEESTLVITILAEILVELKKLNAPQPDTYDGGWKPNIYSGSVVNPKDSTETTWNMPEPEAHQPPTNLATPAWEDMPDEDA